MHLFYELKTFATNEFVIHGITEYVNLPDRKLGNYLMFIGLSNKWCFSYNKLIFTEQFFTERSATVLYQHFYAWITKRKCCYYCILISSEGLSLFLLAGIIFRLLDSPAFFRWMSHSAIVKENIEQKPSVDQRKHILCMVTATYGLVHQVYI